MFPMTITVYDAVQLNAIIQTFQALQASTMPPAAAPEAPPEENQQQEAPKAAKPAKVKSGTPKRTVEEAAKGDEISHPQNTPEPPPAAPGEEIKITYDVVAALVSKLAGRDRKRALSMLMKHDLTTLKDAKPEQLPAIHADFAAAALDS